MGRLGRTNLRRLGFLATLAFIALVIFGITAAQTLSPPPVDLFVEDWSVLPSAFEGMVALGPSSYYRPHDLTLEGRSPNLPSMMVVYRWEGDLAAMVAGRLGLRLEKRIEGEGVFDWRLYSNGSLFMESRAGAFIVITDKRPIGGGFDLEKYSRRLLEEMGLKLDNVEVYPSNGGIRYVVKIKDYSVYGSAASFSIEDGRIMGQVTLPAFIFKPYGLFKLRSIDEALEILEAYVSVGGVLSNLAGWSPDKDARPLCAASTFDFRSARITSVKLAYMVSRGGYLIPVYVLKGYTDGGEPFEAVVDAVDRSSPPTLLES